MCNEFFIDDMKIHLITQKHLISYEKIKKTHFTEIDTIFAEFEKNKTSCVSKSKIKTLKKESSALKIKFFS